MMIYRTLAIGLFTTLVVLPGRAQETLTLQECYALAESHYPLAGQRDLIEQSVALSVANNARKSLPQLSAGAQATYQSDVTQIPIEIPGVKPLSKDQYRVYGEVSQAVYDGGVVRAQERLHVAQGTTETASLEVDLYELRARVSELFFGVLLLEAQEHQHALVKEQLQAAWQDVQAAVRHGAALQADADMLRAEMLTVDQQIVSARASVDASREMLGLLIGQEVTDQTALARPVFDHTLDAIRRPELLVFEARRRQLEARRDALSARTRPNVALFVQGGYGRPGLNMLENDFSPWYLGGIRLHWNISSLYTLRNDAELLALQDRSLAIREEAFLLNTRLSMTRDDREIARYRQLLETDREILRIREDIREVAAARLRAGVLSSADYVREVVAADRARQQQLLHEIQLLMAQERRRFHAGIQ